MNANDVIACYVTDVAVLLPRRQRNDVAYELRALIDEGLRDRAEAEGRDVDEAMATAFLNTFGRPADVAARYRPTLTIIDPEDGHAFLRAAVSGMAVIWVVGLFMRLQQPIASGSDLLRAIGQWWVSTVIASMWWPGLLVVSFGLTSWTRFRWPQTAEWKPRDRDRIRGSRATLVLGIVGIVCGLFVLIDPGWLLFDVMFGGRAAPAAYRALTYTQTFYGRQAPVLLALLALNIPLLIAVIAQGRWSPRLRQLETALALATCAAIAWTVLDGPVFMAPASDGMARLLMALIVVVVLAQRGIALLRKVRPAPG